ncbi:MAG: glycerol-3-phosphate acyltransferase [Meiothermus sp.]|nr:glycerol-3-phosphate acyltransferase [Meiothermus sp.]
MDWLYAALVGYGFGSLPFAYWFGVLQGKNMLAEVVNLEFLPAWRVLGAVPAVMVMVLDAAKGLMAVALGEFVMRQSNPELGGLLGGAFAVIGHCFSVWVLGRGGTGYTPAVGVLFAVNPLILGAAAGLTALGFLLRRSFNQALMLMGVLLPIASSTLTQNLTYLWFGLGIALPMMLKLLLEQSLQANTAAPPQAAKPGAKKRRKRR